MILVPAVLAAVKVILSWKELLGADARLSIFASFILISRNVVLIPVLQKRKPRLRDGK